MIWLRLAPYIAAAGALAFGVWWLVGVIEDRAELRETVASQARSIKTLEERAAQAEQARAVAVAHQKRVEALAREYDALKEALIRGDEDAPIPDWFRDYLDRLLGGLPTDQD